MPKPVTRWRCDGCGDMHLSEASAVLCETSHAVRKITAAFRDDLAAIMARRMNRKENRL